MKAWAKQDSYQMGTNIKAWLFTILRNEFYSQMRKRGREVQDTDGAFTERMSSSFSPASGNGSRRAKFRRRRTRDAQHMRECCLDTHQTTSSLMPMTPSRIENTMPPTITASDRISTGSSTARNRLIAVATSRS